MLGYPTTRAYVSPAGDGSWEEAELASAAVLFGNASAIDFSELSTDKKGIWNTDSCVPVWTAIFLLSTE